MKFNYKNRGFVVLSLSLMLIAVGVVNYQLSKDSTLSVSDEFKAYEQAQIDKNSPDDTTLVDSIDGKVTTDDKDKSTETSSTKDNTKDTAKENSDVENLAKETSKEIEDTLNSKENIDSDTYIVDMKMTREKQRNSLTQDLNEMINNPSTSEEARKEASSMKIQLVKDQEAELKIENILSTKGFENALVYISEGKVNVVVSEEKLDESDAAKIFDLVAEQADVKYENIKLMNNNKN